jgi:hypothetical protein
MRNAFIYYVCFLVLWVSPKYIDTFSCIVSSIHRFQLEKFDLGQFRETINSLDTESHGYNAMCTVQIYKVYGHLAIWFGDTVSNDFYPQDGEIYFRTMVRSGNSTVKILDFLADMK